MALKKLRLQLDAIDQSIMELLSQRFELTNCIGAIKKEQQINVVDETREIEILNKAKNFAHNEEISEVYKAILKTSCKYQVMDYFLLGKHLPYSISPTVHKYLGIDNYVTFETDNLEVVLKKADFKGCNVTIPYKKDAFKLCDEVDDIASSTNVINTIIKRDSKLYGYNTDYYGILALINHYKLDITNKRIIIIGNGATSKTIKCALSSLKPKKIVHLVREVRDSDQYLISEYLSFKDYDMIFNATSYGTSPNLEDKPLFPLEQFTSLAAVVDVVYNPICSPLLEEAAKYQIKAINGLYMLVAQAAYAQKLFLNDPTKIDAIDSCFKEMNKQMLNIALIGMPYSGKTYLGGKLSIALEKPFVDTDQILARQGNSLQQILSIGKTVDCYREEEAKIVASVAKGLGRIISTGGGVILLDANIKALKRNSLIVYIKQDIDTLISRIDDSRPLVQSKDDLIKTYNERSQLYLDAADLVIDGSDDISNIINKIKEALNESCNN